MTASIKSEIDHICKLFDVRYRLIKRTQDWGGGKADTNRNRIFINMSNTKRAEALGILFHEIAHILCTRTRTYAFYHNKTKRLSKQRVIRIASHGLQAELYVDKLGQKLFKTFYPKLKYYKGYKSKEARAWYSENYTSYYKNYAATHYRKAAVSKGA